MAKVAGVALCLPDGRYVFQRRDQQPGLRSAGLLGFFGGGVEKGETFLQAALRELGEETSVKATAENLELVADFVGTDEESLHFNIFRLMIEHDDFEVFEGQGKEAYTKDELLSRDDLTISVQTTLEKL